MAPAPLSSQKHALVESVGKGNGEQETPEWVIFDRKASVALGVAEKLMHSHQMEMAKIASDSLGPQDDDEKQALAQGWTFLERALSMYQQAEEFLQSSQKNVKSSLKEMEDELKNLDDKDAEKDDAKQLLKSVKDFKRHQAEKIQALKDEIERIDTKLEPARNACIGGYAAQEAGSSKDETENEKENALEAKSSSAEKKKNKKK